MHKKAISTTRNIVFSGLFLALCFVLPIFTGNIPVVGSMLSPMHIPVFLCGIICGWQYGLAVGAIAPMLRHLTMGMPPIHTALGMTFELATYGLVIGLCFKFFPKKDIFIWVSLIIAMLVGRGVWGLAAWVIYPEFTGKAFTLTTFLTGAFISAWPGIIIHLMLVPAIILVLRRAKIMKSE